MNEMITQLQTGWNRYPGQFVHQASTVAPIGGAEGDDK